MSPMAAEADPGGLVAALEQAVLPAAGGRVLLCDETGCLGSRAARLARERLATRARVVTGVATGHLDIPYDPWPALVEVLAQDLAEVAPEVLVRYRHTLVTLQPRLREAGPLRGVRPYEAGLLRFAFGGSSVGLRDFFRGRNLGPHVVDDLVRFVLDAAAEPGRPLVLCLERAEEAGAQALRVLSLLAARAAGAPLGLCAVVRPGEGSGPELIALAERAGWEVFRLPAAPGEMLPVRDALHGLGAGARAILEAVAVAGRPVAPGRLARALPEEHCRLREELDDLVAAGLLAECPTAGVWMPPAVAGAVGAGLESTARGELHRRWLEALDGAASPADLAHHAREAGLPGYGSRALAAMEWSWLVSAYDQALAHAAAAAADPEVAAKVNPTLLQGLLRYEARHFAAADRILMELLAKAKQESARIAVLRLAGYSKVFGVRDYQAGLDLLSETLPYYESRQRPGDLANVLNGMAFALLALGRRGEALEMENRALAEVAKLATGDPLLSTLIHVNLGRLYGTQEPARSVQHIRQAIAANEGAMGPHLALMFYGTMGEVHWSAGDLPRALECFHHCAGVSLDVDLAGAGEVVLPKLLGIFEREVGRLEPPGALFGELYRLTLHFNLGLALQRAGLADQAAVYEAWLVDRLERWGDPGTARAVRKAFAREAGPGEAIAPPPALDAPLERCSDVLTRVEAGDRVAEVVAALERGEAVAWVSPSVALAEVRLLDRLVLFDPRSGRLGRRVRRDLCRAPHSGVALVLPGATGGMRGSDPGFPRIVQEVSLEPEDRKRFPALAPARSRAVVLDGLDSPDLFRLLEEWQRRTGVGLLAAVTLRVAGEDLADGEQAIKVFLETSIELLVLEGRLLRKRWGPLAERNLLRLRPRLHQPLVGTRGEGVVDGPGYIATPRVQMKLGAAGFALLDRIDANQCVEQLLGPVPESERTAAIRFLRMLRQYRVIGFSLCVTELCTEKSNCC